MELDLIGGLEIEPDEVTHRLARRAALCRLLEAIRRFNDGFGCHPGHRVRKPSTSALNASWCSHWTQWPQALKTCSSEFGMPAMSAAGIQRHEAIVAAPHDQRRGTDFAEARAEIGELLGIELEALDEILEMIAPLQQISRRAWKSSSVSRLGSKTKMFIIAFRFSMVGAR